jgi:uncharacterized RDD family membrane protein YckC
VLSIVGAISKSIRSTGVDCELLESGITGDDDPEHCRDTSINFWSPIDARDLQLQQENLEYVGFWLRVGASLIDTVLVSIIVLPIIHLIYGPAYWVSSSFIQGPGDFLVSWVMPAVAVILFWIARQATPGKMAIGAKIVDASSGQAASPRQLVGRYFGYYASMLPLFLGFIWVAFDARKQGWHDKLAGTVVVRTKKRGQRAVEFSTMSEH